MLLAHADPWRGCWRWRSWGCLHPRSLKSTTTATMVGGPKEFGGTKGMFTVLFENILETLLVLPQSLFCPLKFSLWSSQNHCSVPSNSVYSPPKIFVLPPPNYKSLFPHQNHCYVPSNSAYPVSNSVYSPPKILFCPLLITKNHCSPQKSLCCPL